MILFVSKAFKLMHKYGIHAVTQLSCLGLLKDAKNLAQVQNESVDFIIYNFPVISKALQRIFWAFEDDPSLQILKGTSPESSGNCCTPVNINRFVTPCIGLGLLEVRLCMHVLENI